MTDKLTLPSATEQDLKILTNYDILDTPAESGYDDITTLAAQICDTPIAYVSFVDKNRQWFKAKLGFTMAENTLDKSFCLHTLRHGEMLVIPDLALDPRTAQNAMVTSQPKLRFYAGALLKSPDGVVLGTLCVMDVIPHLDGLSFSQKSALSALARQVTELLELRRFAHERDLVRAELQASEQKYRAVFESAIDYAMIVMTRDGVITDWNEGANRIFGWSRAEMHSQSVDLIFTPEDLKEKIPQREIEAALNLGRGLDERWHLRKNGERFWASGEMMPLRKTDGTTIGIVKILRDKTKQRENAVQRSALFDLVEKLQTAQSSESILDAAVVVLQKYVAFDRAGFARTDALGKMIDIEKSWVAEGLSPIVEPIQFPESEEIAKGEMIVVHDIESSSLSSRSKETFRSLKLRAAILTPLMENGKTVAVFSVNSQHQQNWTNSEVDIVRAIADRTHAALGRIEAEAQQKILNNELSHRLKNTLTIVRAIANQTLKHTLNSKDLHDFEERLVALGTAHDVLFKHDWTGGKIHSLIEATLEIHASKNQMLITGPDIELGPTAAVSLSLLLHELATNAVKYGALSTSAGRIIIDWSLTGVGQEQQLILTWRERGGPPVSHVRQKGFGSKLIANGLSGNKQAELSYDPLGFEVKFQAPLSTLRAN